MVAPSVYEIQGFAAHLEQLLDTTDPEEWEAKLGEALDAFDGDVVDLVAHLGTLRQRYGEFAKVNRELSRSHQQAAQRWEKRYTAVVEQTRSALLAHERVTGDTKVQTHLGTAYLQTREQLRHPANIDEWPAELLQEEVRIKPDRAAAKAAVKAGTAPEGFALEPVQSVAWRKA